MTCQPIDALTEALDATIQHTLAPAHALTFAQRTENARDALEGADTALERARIWERSGRVIAKRLDEHCTRLATRLEASPCPWCVDLAAGLVEAHHEYLRWTEQEQ